MTKQSTTTNPQDWLRIGQLVRAPEDKKFYGPRVHVDGGFFYTARDGIIVEHLANGGVAVKFTDYPNTVDYTAKEAARFTRCH